MTPLEIVFDVAGVLEILSWYLTHSDWKFVFCTEKLTGTFISFVFLKIIFSNRKKIVQKDWE